MKNIFLLASALFILSVTTSLAQGNLVFREAKLISSSIQTVPSGRVWKITSLSGAVYNTLCVPRPDLVPNPTQWVKAAIASGFEVNGQLIYSTLRYPTSTQRFSDINCTIGLTNQDYSSYSQSTDPLILPMWLPAGTTLKTIGSGVFVSVLEFDVVE